MRRLPHEPSAGAIYQRRATEVLALRAFGSEVPLLSERAGSSLALAGGRMKPLKIFIGYDPAETVAWSVLAHSILSRATIPVALIPLARQGLRREYTRPRGETESTDFSLTRFLVPYLCDYQGLAVFMDCDMLCRVDIGDLMLPILADPGRAVYCCLHDYVPKDKKKFLGNIQTQYPRKNWSSFMVFDCAKCTALSKEYVHQASGLQLHRFEWIANDLIGSLPIEWNWLVGEYPKNPKAQVLHWTLGGPWFEDTKECDHADLWRDELARMTGAVQVAHA